MREGMGDMRKRIFKKKSRGRLAVAAFVLTGLLVPAGAAWAAPPANDEMASAVSVSSLPYTSTQLTNEATGAQSDPDCFGGGRTVWYSFAAAESRWVSVDTLESNYDTTLGVYIETEGTLTEVSCNDNFGPVRQSRVSFETVAGTTYHFMVGSLNTGTRGTLRINVRDALPPAPNDDVPTVVGSLPFADSVDASTSTAGQDDPECTGSAHTVWYSYTPQEDVRLLARTSESPWDTVVAGYQVTTGGLDQLFCTDSPDVTFKAHGGSTYLIMVGNWYDAPAGDLHFSLDEAPAPVEVDAKISDEGRIRNVSGAARITVRIRCSEVASVNLSGLVKQRRDDVIVSTGFNKSGECNQRWTAFTATANPYGTPYKVGKAIVRANVFVTADERTGRDTTRKVVDLK
jgi:hypothetical protein